MESLHCRLLSRRAMSGRSEVAARQIGLHRFHRFLVVSVLIDDPAILRSHFADRPVRRQCGAIESRCLQSVTTTAFSGESGETGEVSLIKRSSDSFFGVKFRLLNGDGLM